MSAKFTELESSLGSMNEDIVLKIFMGLETFKEEINDKIEKET